MIACAACVYCARCETSAVSSATAGWPGAELFADSKPSRIRIEVGPQELANLRTEAREFIHAQVTEAGVLYPDVAVHLKGSVGSFRTVDDKPGFTLDFARFHPTQRFHELRRIHLNNSVEDPTYCNEQLGSELFRHAGIPAPRVSRAVVTLNDRKLGLYVLKEGFTEDFLGCYFGKISGNLFEPGEGHDVNQHLKRASIHAPSQGRAALHRLAEAALERDKTMRWQRLSESLNLDQFIRFMALEVLVGHRDGYCLARNNFRVYQDPDSGKMIFFPHGMDQLFGRAELPWKPHLAGLVAQAVMDTQEGQVRYRETFMTLLNTLPAPEILTNRVNQIVDSFHTNLNELEFSQTKIEAAALNQRILERWRYLKTEINGPGPESLNFRDGVSPLAGWTKADEPKAGQMDQCLGPGNASCLRILTSSNASASWRTKAWLGPGRYRFEGKARVSEVKPLGFGTHQGAGVRISGEARQSTDLIGTSDWQVIAVEFQVIGAAREVEFICELRASTGQAWFDTDSLRVIQVKE